MRIAVISDLWVPFPGGAERFMFNITRELKRRGHEVYVYCSYENVQEFDGIKPFYKSTGVHKYDACLGHTHADGWKDVCEFIVGYRAEVILTHGFFANEFAEMFDLGIPVVQVLHNGKPHPKASFVVYNSEYTRQKAADGRPGMVILPPAFDDVIAPQKEDGYVGFIKPIAHKGVEFVYALAQHLLNREFLILHGEWTHIEIIRHIPNVKYLTARQDIRDFYKRCRVVLVPSTYEDAGTVPQEAALNGLPCISSDVMGLKETNKGGIILPPHVHLWDKALSDLDNPIYYNDVVARQKEYIQSLNWPGQFDALSAKINTIGK